MPRSGGAVETVYDGGGDGDGDEEQWNGSHGEMTLQSCRYSAWNLFRNKLGSEHSASVTGRRWGMELPTGVLGSRARHECMPLA